MLALYPRGAGSNPAHSTKGWGCISGDRISILSVVGIGPVAVPTDW